MSAAPEPGLKPPAGRVSLVISDVDGTLVTPDKVLTPKAIAAAGRLRAEGIAFTIISSRPPRGLAMLVGPLAIEGTLAAYNGGAILRPDLSALEQHLVPAEAARFAIEVMGRHGADIWLFSGRDWLLTDPDGAYVALERRTVLFEPTLVPSFGPFIDKAGKIVGASRDFDGLKRCETELAAAFDGAATVHRSQLYYLDVTHPLADKGYGVGRLAAVFGVPLEEVAVVGDMTNDLPMFAEAGLAIAMGNAPPEVKARAHLVAASNSEDGFADAVERFILPRAAARSSAP